MTSYDISPNPPSWMCFELLTKGGLTLEYKVKKIMVTKRELPLFLICIPMYSLRGYIHILMSETYVHIIAAYGIETMLLDQKSCENQ